MLCQSNSNFVLVKNSAHVSILFFILLLLGPIVIVNTELSYAR